jgi:iron complex outermembrane receptor protein
MNKVIMLLVSMCIFFNVSKGQSSYTIKGIVLDENNEALMGASVFLNPIEKMTITDSEGKFVFHNLVKNKYIVGISFIGYKNYGDTIFLSADKSYRVQLKRASLSLQEVVVSDNYAESEKKEESLNIEVVNDEYLKHYRGGSLMNSLERLPGLSTIDIGSGHSKPVIRGLGFNRVVVVENNIKHEAQQWGADHGLEIDQYAVDEVKIIKGPASLMYGSDAIGGVIDIKDRKIPADHSIGGSIAFTGKSYNEFAGTSLSVFGRKKWFFTKLRATILDYGDYKVPTDSIDIYSYRAALKNNQLRNTAGMEKNLHATVGIIKNRFQTKLHFSSVNTKSGFFANAHGLEPRNVNTSLHDKDNRDINDPFQTVNHLKLISSSHYQWEKLKLELDVGFQHNQREEWSEYVSHGFMPPVFPDSMGFDPDLERQFSKRVYSAKLGLSYHINDKIRIHAGLNSEHQFNEIDGRGFIIPAFKQNNIGTYALAKYEISGISKLQFGIRYDYSNIHAFEYDDWFASPVIEGGDTSMQQLMRSGDIVRDFSSISWSAGYIYDPEKWLLKFNIGKSFRVPIAKELAANGVNYHRFSYEVGDPDLSPEISYQIDAGIEYSTERFVLGTSPFLNYFTNYIYLNPSADHDRLYGNGNQVCYYTQCEVLRYGGEIHAHYQLLKSLQMGVIGEYVYSEQLSGEKKGFSLPFSPPLSGIVNLKYQKEKIRFINNAFLSLDYRLTAAQKNIVPPEVMTDGYTVVNVSCGGNIKIKKTSLEISLQLRNLFNKKYFNHTSYYRLINVPEPGRNYILNLSIPFSGKFKQKNIIN